MAGKRVMGWAIALLICVSGASRGADLIQNGNFSSGNTGFTSSYAFSNDLGSTGSETRYTVGGNPHDFNSQAASFGDHTTGTGLMLIVNGAVTSNVTIWQETVPVAANNNYRLGGFLRSWGGALTDPSSALFHVEINGQGVGLDDKLPSSVNSWVSFGRDWNSGAATTATIRFVDLNIAEQGNDFSIDDVSFVPEPVGTSIVALSGVGALCRRNRRRE